MRSSQIQDADFEWFVENYQNLFQQYGNSFLAIKNKSVLAAYDSYADAVRETQKKELLGTFIVQKCDGTESAYSNYIASFNIPFA